MKNIKISNKFQQHHIIGTNIYNHTQINFTSSSIVRKKNKIWLISYSNRTSAVVPTVANLNCLLSESEPLYARTWAKFWMFSKKRFRERHPINRKGKGKASRKCSLTTPTIKGLSTWTNALSTAEMKLGWTTLKGSVASGKRTTPNKYQAALFFKHTQNITVPSYLIRSSGLKTCKSIGYSVEMTSKLLFTSLWKI